MTAKQKRFILQKLCPFILREQGRGFVMADWILKMRAKAYANDDLARNVKAPSCGMACCIGGSIEVLRPEVLARLRERHPELRHINFTEAGAAIGLDCVQSEVLFHQDIHWPEPHNAEFRKAKTPLGKAKAAVALLKEVVRTNGKCLYVQS